jgi:hypothetical protein
MFKIINLLILMLLLPVPIQASEVGIVINSYRISGQSSTDEYIEIYNASNQDINLFGWRLAKKTSSGNSSNLLTTFPEIFIEPDSVLVIGHENCICSPDLIYSTSSSVASDNTIILYSDNGKTVVDKVGFGNAIDFETAPAKNPDDFEIYGRKNNGLDTNNNKADFHLLYTPPKPKEEPITKTQKPDSKKTTEGKNNFGAKLIVTEFLPNPEGPDSENEFIEIKNVGPRAEIGGYYIADTIGSPKSYKIPEETILESGAYLAFYSAKTPISLNNKGDGVEVWDPDKKVIDSSPDDCGKAIEGMSYALGSKGWSWTKTPTPGKANIITEPTEEELKGKDSAEDKLMMIDEADFKDKEIKGSQSLNSDDKFFGIVLVVVAISGTIFYTLYTNKEKIRELYHKKRSRNNSLGAKIRARIKGR